MTASAPARLQTRTETFTDGLTVRFDERGSGRPVLVLHGGAGPQSVSAFSEALATRARSRPPILALPARRGPRGSIALMTWPTPIWSSWNGWTCGMSQ